MPPMPPMLLMQPMLRRVGFTSSPLAEDGYTMVTHLELA